jgi:hypothetical protein
MGDVGRREILPLPGSKSLGFSVRCQSLYHLRCPGSHVVPVESLNVLFRSHGIIKADFFLGGSIIEFRKSRRRAYQDLAFFLNLECLHTVACVRSGEGSFVYPSTQRHYRRLIYIHIYIYISTKHLVIKPITIMLSVE